MQTFQSPRLFSKMLNAIGAAIIIVSTFLTGSVARAQQEYYYYADGHRITLTPSQSWVSVTFTSDDETEQSAALGSTEGARLFPLLRLALLPNVKESAATVDSLRASKAVSQISPVFQTADAEMVITDEFIVTFPANTGMDKINAINASYGVEIVSEVLGQENTFVLRATDKAQLDLLSLANRYQESGAAIHSAPNFVRIFQKMSPTPPTGPLAGTNDTFYPNQWYLNNTQQNGAGTTLDADIDAPEAWNITTGSASVIIAVIDEGVDLNHQDYSTKLAPGYDATGLGSGGHPSGNDAHGTSVAGIAAAFGNNNMGVAGVCRDCRIMPVRIAYSVGNNWATTDATLANGITWAYQNGADVLNNSWGGGLSVTVINNAIANAKNLGRDGKGAVVIFAAGNSDLSSVAYPGYLSTVIAVGASNMCDQRKQPVNNLCNGYEYYWGSNYGTALDVSAPGVWLYTTDIMGAAGYSAGNYYAEFNGTSGASPVVSGVAGLILSANPNLTATEVQTILQDTADDVNGGGFDAQMGHGRVNAYAAVQAAGVPSIFVDVPNTYWAWDFIERLYNAGITSGCSTSPMMYCPTTSVTRAQMAIFILRGIHGSAYSPPAATGTIFSDVPAGSFGAAWIERLAAEGITSGCGSGKYCPNNNVTRAEMAIFLLRAKYGSAYSPPVATGMFTDVPVGSFAANWIEKLAADGITGGCGGGKYCPASPVLRDQMAVFLVKTFNLP
ncbi:MAG: S8 family serine peptidase [Chloroflexi bacterium]|nr:S8 family serine peptidase [Chloroflexota bacterium]